jgi:hypothetical protein
VVTYIGGAKSALMPCPVCATQDGLLLLGERHDPLPWGRRLLAVVRPPAVTRVYLCAVCDEVVVVRAGAKDAPRRGQAARRWRAAPAPTPRQR